MEDGPVTKGPPRSSELAAQLPSSSAKPLSDEDAAYEAYTRYEQTWDLAHIDDAIRLYQRAIDAAPEPDARLLGWLGYCLNIRYQNQGKLEDLERGIVAEQGALQLTSDKHPDKARRLNELSFSLRRRYERLGELDDLKSAITMQQRSVELTPADHPSLSRSLDNLGSLYYLRYERFGALDDLEHSIANQRRAVDLEPDDHPDKPIRLNNLGASLRRRFEHLGEPDDLERAITAQRRAVELTPDGHPYMPASLVNLGGLQRLRYERFGNLEDLQRAIEGQRRAVDLTPPGHPNKPLWLNNLGLSLCRRFERLGEPDDLERAITAQRRAVELTPEGHPDMPAGLDNLGYLQRLRYEHFGDLEGLERAISGQQRAVKLTPDGHPSKAYYLNNLGLSLLLQFHRRKTGSSHSMVLSCFMTATAQSLVSPNLRIATAKFVVGFLEKYNEFSPPTAMILAHSRIMEILPELTWLGHSLTRRLDESKQFGKLVNGAVCAAIGAGAMKQAVEWLEAGRGLIWTQALLLRNPLDDLERLHPELARPIRRVLCQLQDTALTPSPGAIVVKSDPLQISSITTVGDRHRGLAIEYGRLLSEVRRQSGFEDFMLPKKLAALLPSSTSLSGPIIFLNLDRVRCAAVILSPDGTITTVTLQELSLDRARKMRVLWLGYLQRRDVRQRMAACVGSSSEDIVVARVLGRIWKWIVDPVLKALKISKRSRQDRLPHITWCPTGQLTQLPIHAAGIYDEECGPRLYNLAVSSYTPSLSALTRSINAAVKSRASPSVLIVTQPKTPGLAPLPGTIVERTRLVNVLSKFDVGSATLMGGEASIDTIRGALEVHPWLHLACHGCQDTSDPLKSAFALEGGYLTLSDLMTTVSDYAELAFLSACQTAVGDEKIPEESMHLAAGMLAVGFEGVIATMWSIGDHDAPLVVEEYYKVLLELRASGKVGEGETGAAYALHEATRRLREVVGDREYMRWAPFVHFGI